MDKEINNPNFKLTSEEHGTSFEKQLELHFKLNIGQAGVEELYCLPPEFIDNDFGLRLSIKVKSEGEGKKVADTIKGLYAMLKLAPEIGDLIKDVNVTISRDENYVYLQICSSTQTLIKIARDEMQLWTTYDCNEGEDFPDFGILTGKSEIKVASQFNPLYIVDKHFLSFIDDCFVFSIEGVSENQLNFLIKMMCEDFRKKQLNGYSDLIQEKIEVPVYNYLTNYEKIDGPIKFDKTYSAQLFKEIIYEYNKGFEGEGRSIVLESENFQNEFNNDMIGQIKGFTKGFFKPHFEVLKGVDLNNWKLDTYLKEKGAVLRVDLSVKGVNEYVDKKFFQ